MSLRVVATPVATPSPSPEPTPVPTLPPTPTPSRKPVKARIPTPRPAWPAPNAGVFRGLGAWYDLYDDETKLTAAIADMAARGVKTLYLEWEKSSCRGGPKAWNPATFGRALDDAHARGLAVVAWYYLDFTDVQRDLDRTLAAVNYRSPGGQRFDGLGVDIEDNACVTDPVDRNARLLDYSRRLRTAAGAGYPLAAIVIAPSSLTRNPNRWPDFPWTALAPLYDVFMPMTYWTGTGADPRTASERTAENAKRTAELTGGRPVHVIGGIADRIDVAQAKAYVDAALANGSIGGGLYDYTTTRPEVWGELGRLNR